MNLYEFRIRRIRRSIPCEGEKILGPEDVLRWMAACCSELDRENFFSIHLDNRGCVIGWERVAVGGLDSVMVHPREVFRAALLSGAARIILAHNHPSGGLDHSEDDDLLVRRMSEAGKLLGVEVLDSVVVANGQFRSMANSLAGSVAS